MDIRLLKTFCTVAKLENITHAAEMLNFTQPTVSAQIRTLEEHLGVPLFERIGKKIYITDAGKCLMDPAEQILKIYGDTVARMKCFATDCCIRVGISTSYINSWLSPALRKLQTGGTQGKFYVENCLNSIQVLNGVKNNQYDIGIVHDLIAEKHLNTVILNSEELVWVGHKNLIQSGDCPRIDEYPVINFRQGCTFRSLCDVLLYKRGLNSVLEYSDFDAVKNAMIEGLGIALLPRIVVENLMRQSAAFYIFNENSHAKIPLFAITRKDKYLPATVETLVGILQESKPAI